MIEDHRPALPPGWIWNNESSTLATAISTPAAIHPKGVVKFTVGSLLPNRPGEQPRDSATSAEADERVAATAWCYHAEASAP